MTIAVAFLVFGLWTIYRFLFPENLALDELLIKPVIWLLPVFLATRFKNIGYSSKKLYKNILIGLGLGLVFSLERIFTKTNYTFEFSWLLVLTSLATAITEETFFRGYLLGRWLKSLPQSWMAMLINALFFTYTHLPIAIFRLNYRGWDLLTYLMSSFAAGFVNVYLYFITGSLAAPIANHFVWNTFSSIFR